MHQDVQTVMFSEEEITARVGALAKELDAEYAGKNPLMVAISIAAASAAQNSFFIFFILYSS